MLASSRGKSGMGSRLLMRPLHATTATFLVLCCGSASRPNRATIPPWRYAHYSAVMHSAIMTPTHPAFTRVRERRITKHRFQIMPVPAPGVGPSLINA
jgi:hypothetical protein